MHVDAGSRVLLRPPSAGDEAEILRLNRASRAFHSPWVAAPRTPAGFKVYLARDGAPDQEARLVCRCVDGAIVGVINLSQIFRGNFKGAYLGYYIGAGFARQGYMREAVDLMLRHAFVHLGLHRVEANVQPANLASVALVRSLGFRLEGRSRRYLKIAGRWRDHLRWAILAEEWRESGSRRTAGPHSSAHRVAERGE